MASFLKGVSQSLLMLAIISSPIARAVDTKADTSKSYYNQEQQPTPIFITPDQLHWNSIESLPGAYCALLDGDPSKKGPYIVRLKLPANYKVPPNWQTATIFVTVISGSYHIGVGDKFDREQGKTLMAGSSVVIPSKSHLYFWTTQEVILQVHGIGPWNVHYIDPSDDPRKN